jgi:hypothetical protein
VFSDGNCANTITDYSADLADLDRFVDWPLMNEHIWKDTLTDGDRKRRRMAEFLVHEHLPWSAVLGFAVHAKRLPTGSPPRSVAWDANSPSESDPIGTTHDH